MLSREICGSPASRRVQSWAATKNPPKRVHQVGGPINARGFLALFGLVGPPHGSFGDAGHVMHLFDLVVREGYRRVRVVRGDEVRTA